ncbi:hypothetical protein D2T29_14915 [Sinirhodobacter populi]|uniref:Creatinase N-terminal domain-containing protein n=2 Tax=Paenirhodobacter populi TaxID=2306993 RepID=A0A443K9J1_9RHOB|nr:hypothetical protein D2T29_14915 [Sinirhodobacter populi]
MPADFQPAIPFAREEHEARQRRLRRRIREMGANAMLVFSQESLYWLTGYDSGGFVFPQCAVVTPHPPQRGTNVMRAGSAGPGNTFSG